MSPTLGMTGMDPATESSLKAAFEQANARLQGRWRLAPEAEADYVAVDMDSMYGPMSWLRLHAAGKQVVGLTSARRSQTDFHLPRPFDANALAELLQSIDGGAAPTAAPAPAPAPAGMAPAPVPQDELPEEHRQRSDEEQHQTGRTHRGTPGRPDLTMAAADRWSHRNSTLRPVSRTTGCASEPDAHTSNQTRIARPLARRASEVGRVAVSALVHQPDIRRELPMHFIAQP